MTFVQLTTPYEISLEKAVSEYTEEIMNCPKTSGRKLLPNS